MIEEIQRLTDDLAKERAFFADASRQVTVLVEKNEALEQQLIKAKQEAADSDRLNDEYAMIIYGSTAQSDNLHKQKVDEIAGLKEVIKALTATINMNERELKAIKQVRQTFQFHNLD